MIENFTHYPWYNYVFRKVFLKVQNNQKLDGMATTEFGVSEYVDELSFITLDAF
jgi:hypothetical protein